MRHLYPLKIECVFFLLSKFSSLLSKSPPKFNPSHTEGKRLRSASLVINPPHAQPVQAHSWSGCTKTTEIQLVRGPGCHNVGSAHGPGAQFCGIDPVHIGIPITFHFHLLTRSQGQVHRRRRFAAPARPSRSGCEGSCKVQCACPLHCTQAV